MTKREANIVRVLDSLCEDHQTVKVFIKGFRSLKGSLSSSKGKYHIGTSTTLFTVVPKEVVCIKNLRGEKLT